MENHKEDKEYGCRVSLDPERKITNGYMLPELNGLTDTEALQKIINSYIDDSSMDNLTKFMRYKLDFAITFLDTIYLIIGQKYSTTLDYYDEIDGQLNDISHKITQPYLDGKCINKDEKLKIYDEQEKALVYRRDLKDALSVMTIIMENIEKSRNFILGMDKRQYSSKSAKYKRNPDFHIKSKESIRY